MITAAATELRQAGVTVAPDVVLADAGYWNGPQIDALVSRGMQVLVRPDADTRKAPSRLRSEPNGGSSPPPTTSSSSNAAA